MISFIKRHFGLVFIVAFAAVAGTFLLQPKAPAKIELVQVTKNDVVRVLTLNGRVRAFDVADIKPRRAGTLQEILVDEGDTVEQGQVLARIQNAQETALLAQNTKAAAVRKLQLAQAERDYNRVKTLKADGFATTDRFEQARLGVQTAQADLARLEAVTAQSKANLDDTLLTAPFAGVIQRKLVDQGTSVGTDTTVFTIAATGAQDIEAEADEIYAASLKSGQTAFVTAPSLTKPLTGKIEWLAPNIDTRSGGLLLRVQADGVNALPPGLSVSLTIEVNESKNALTLPRSAVLTPQSAPAVMRFDVATSKVVKTPIQVIDWPSAAIEITGGLTETDRVAVAPRGLTDGQVVTPKAPD